MTLSFKYNLLLLSGLVVTMLFDNSEIEILQVINQLKQHDARRDHENRTPEQNERYLRYLEGKDDAYNEVLCNFGNFEVLIDSCNFEKFKERAFELIKECHKNGSEIDEFDE